MWLSADGTEWERVDLDRREPGTAGETHLSSLVVGGGQELVAFGVEQVAEGSRPVVFTSLDGDTWVEAPVDFPSTEAGADVVGAAETFEGNVLAVVNAGDATQLLVPEGPGWSVRELPNPEFSSITTSVRGLVSAENGMWMVGSERGEQDQDGPHRSSGPDPAWELTPDSWLEVSGTDGAGSGAMLAGVQIDGHAALVVGDTAGPSGSGEVDAAAWLVDTEGAPTS